MDIGAAKMKNIWDHMRAVNLLQALPEVDGECPYALTPEAIALVQSATGGRQ